MSEVLKIYDISKDAMRLATQQDIDDLHGALMHFSWVKDYIHKLSAPGVARKITPAHREALAQILNDIIMEARPNEHSPSTPVS